MVGQVEASCLLAPKIRLWRQIFPYVPATDSPFIHFSMGLTNGPYHSEIPDRGSYSSFRSFKNFYRKSPERQGPCRSQPYNTCAYNDSGSRLHRISLLIVLFINFCIEDRPP